MTVELKMLLLAVLIPLVMVSAQGTLLVLKMGMPSVLGNRDNFAVPQGWQARWVRAHGNQLENLLLFGLVVLVAHAAGVSNHVTQLAAELFVAARLLHALSYVAGILYVRTAAFYAGLLCIYAIVAQLLL